LYGVSIPLGAEAKLHHMCASKLPPITAPTRAGVRYGAPALRMAPVHSPKTAHALPHLVRHIIPGGQHDPSGTAYPLRPGLWALCVIFACTEFSETGTH
jgi:hypothetical protein